MLIALSVCRPSEGVVARRIESQLIIVPVVAGIGDLEDELYALNDAGAAIWERLDGARTLAEIARDLATAFDGDEPAILEDVIGLTTELLRRGIIVEARPA